MDKFIVIKDDSGNYVLAYRIPGCPTYSSIMQFTSLRAALFERDARNDIIEASLKLIVDDSKKAV